MKSPTPMRRWPQVRPVPFALAVAMAAVTSYVLFEDVLHGATLTTTHVTSAATLIATIAAGHLLWPQLRAGKAISALGLALVFLAGTAYVVTMSGARNAETAAAKRQAAAEDARQRADIERMKSEAMTILAACPTGTPREHVGIRCGLRDAMTAECGSGKGKRCDGKAYSVRTYEAALTGYDAKLEALGPAKRASGYRHAAEVLAALPFVSEDASAIEARLTLVLPYLLVLVVEVATLTFSHMALEHRAPAPQTKAAPETPVRKPAAPQSEKPTPPRGPRRKTGRPSDQRVIDFVDRFRTKHGRPPTGTEIRSEFTDLPKSTAFDHAARARTIALVRAAA